MSNENGNVVYKVRVGSAEYGADDKASAESLAELLGGEVFTTSRKEALAHVRTITKVDPIPARFAEFVGSVKSMLNEALDVDECWQITCRCDKRTGTFYINMKNEELDGPVYDENGTHFTSYAAARWHYGQRCNVQYLRNGIREDGKSTLKFSKTNPMTTRQTLPMTS